MIQWSRETLAQLCRPPVAHRHPDPRQPEHPEQPRLDGCGARCAPRHPALRWMSGSGALLLVAGQTRWEATIERGYSLSNQSLGMTPEQRDIADAHIIMTLVTEEAFPDLYVAIRAGAPSVRMRTIRSRSGSRGCSTASSPTWRRRAPDLPAPALRARADRCVSARRGREARAPGAARGGEEAPRGAEGRARGGREGARAGGEEEMKRRFLVAGFVAAAVCAVALVFAFDLTVGRRGRSRSASPPPRCSDPATC